MVNGELRIYSSFAEASNFTGLTVDRTEDKWWKSETFQAQETIHESFYRISQHCDSGTVTMGFWRFFAIFAAIRLKCLWM